MDYYKANRKKTYTKHRRPTDVKRGYLFQQHHHHRISTTPPSLVNWVVRVANRLGCFFGCCGARCNLVYEARLLRLSSFFCEWFFASRLATSSRLRDQLLVESSYNFWNGKMMTGSLNNTTQHGWTSYPFTGARALDRSQIYVVSDCWKICKRQNTLWW